MGGNAAQTESEWTYEGGRKPFWLVAADGSRTRYPRGLHICVRNERSLYAATRVVPQDVNLVPKGTGFLFFWREF